MTIPKDLMQDDMEKLKFVTWDRFVVNPLGNRIELFGWIKRIDSHEDFVVLTYNLCSEDDVKQNWGMKFCTSSKKYSGQIALLLGCDRNHTDCIRVEDHFTIKNCIRMVR